MVSVCSFVPSEIDQSVSHTILALSLHLDSQIIHRGSHTSPSFLRISAKCKPRLPESSMGSCLLEVALGLLSEFTQSRIPMDSSHAALYFIRLPLTVLAL
jgi:hypothetical protein